MSLSAELTLTLKQGLSLTGGLTSQTVFPLTEEKLNNTDYQKALEFAGRRKNMDKYESMMDFLFCESFSEWRWKAFRFYNGEGCQLIDDAEITDEMLNAYDVFMCEAILEMCLIALNDKRRISWSTIKQEADLLLKVA